MNKYFKILAICLLSAAVHGCEQPQIVESVQKVVIEASMEMDQDTKTYLSHDAGGMYYPFWDSSDAIAVYSEGVSDPSRFDLIGGKYTTSATFSGYINGECLYGLYPYDIAGTFQDGVIYMTLPYEQEYKHDSFGN